MRQVDKAKKARLRAAIMAEQRRKYGAEAQPVRYGWRGSGMTEQRGDLVNDGPKRVSQALPTPVTTRRECRSFYSCNV